MTDYNPIFETETNPGKPSKSGLWKRWSKNWIAGFERAVGAPHDLAKWHPYNSLAVGDAFTGIIYNNAVDGNVATFETPLFEDGYEYLFAARNLSTSTATVVSLSLFRQEAAAYTGAIAISGSVPANTFRYHADIELREPRISSLYVAFSANGVVSDGTNNIAPTIVAFDRGVSFSTAQRISKARFEVGAGNFDDGTVKMYKRLARL